jgi:hypothetical protein
MLIQNKFIENNDFKLRNVAQFNLNNTTNNKKILNQNEYFKLRNFAEFKI